MMEILGHLGDGILVSLQPLNLLLILIGVTLGLFIGAMPGLGSVNGVAILLPITFLVPPGSAIIFLAAIYYGAMYGGAISSITLGIPGASTAVATTFDGRPLALQGRAQAGIGDSSHCLIHWWLCRQRTVYRFCATAGLGRAELWSTGDIRSHAAGLCNLRRAGWR